MHCDWLSSKMAISITCCPSMITLSRLQAKPNGANSKHAARRRQNTARENNSRSN